MFSLKGSFAGVVFVAVLSIISAVGLAASQSVTIKDVASDNVAYESVKLLVSRGYLPLYDDSTFKGSNPVDRYTLAIAIGKLINEIEQGKIRLSDTDQQLLTKVSTEFRQELVNLGVKVDTLNSGVSKLRSDLNTFKGEQQGKDQLEKMTIEKQASDIEALRAKTVDDIKSLEIRVGTMVDDKVGKALDNNQRIQQLIKDVEMLKIQNDQLTKDVEKYKAELTDRVRLMQSLVVVGVIINILVTGM